MPEQQSFVEVAESVDAPGLGPGGASPRKLTRPVRVRLSSFTRDLLFGKVYQKHRYYACFLRRLIAVSALETVPIAADST